ncbi:hypothetical protein [Bifidobacterium cuniculi]|uniref:Uncharacterized protein n=1 Tax=Bifidobacterium cuniculi TaxID=1688 RepID=A0A087B3Y6_9BIFI|nr:hypothetical protein [Bifidobacterium cuniculi]KFI65736.1 hypothetical protein BCUN_0231 [Bifidobacterium cuniculi]
MSGFNDFNPQSYQNTPSQESRAASIMGVDEFGAGGAKAFFNADSQVGDSVTGQVLEEEILQVTDFDDHTPKYWADGTPQRQMRIIIQTDLHDDEYDDGTRAIYIKGWGVQMQAYRAARRANHNQPPRPGDTFTATFTGLGPRGKKGQPPKLYRYEITPAPAKAVADFGAPQPAAQPAPSTPAQEQAQAAPQGAPAALTPEQVATITALRDAGLGPDQVAAQLHLPVQQVYQAGQRPAAQEPAF